ncbi:MAG: hypothetical protein FWD66_05210 [Paludibacter sp.]|nr:hypothetical protein [Paludibacter sp.]
MKNSKCLILTMALSFSATIFAQVGINTQTPDPSAALDVVSNEKGFLYPRMTTANRMAITAPADGLQVYDTDEHCLMIYQNNEWICPNGDIQMCVTTTVVVQYTDSTGFQSNRSTNTGMTAIIDASTAIYDPQNWVEIVSNGSGVGSNMNIKILRTGKYLVSLFGTLQRLTLGGGTNNGGSNTYSSLSFYKDGSTNPAEVLGYVDLPGQTPGRQTYMLQGIIAVQAGDIYVLQCKTEAVSSNYNWANMSVIKPYLELQALE